MTDNRMKDRVKVMLGTSPDGVTSEHALVSHTPVPGLPNQALQVLSMAQRTAEEHVGAAHQQADKIRTDALAAAVRTLAADGELARRIGGGGLDAYRAHASEAVLGARWRALIERLRRRRINVD